MLEGLSEWADKKASRGLVWEPGKDDKRTC